MLVTGAIGARELLVSNFHDGDADSIHISEDCIKVYGQGLNVSNRLRVKLGNLNS